MTDGRRVSADPPQPAYVERPTAPKNVSPGRMLFIRLWRWDRERLRKDAHDDFVVRLATTGAPPENYSISVFGLRRLEGETMEQLTGRVIVAARKARDAKAYQLATEDEFESAGLEWRSTPPPPDDHFDVFVGRTSIDEQRLVDLESIFGIDEKIRMPT